uniref:Uncharacterized protein n=1 Tax=Cacopsylla melanoneura TaxID=428564 RepID=A0A8D8QW77_9HEMI
MGMKQISAYKKSLVIDIRTLDSLVTDIRTLDRDDHLNSANTDDGCIDYIDPINYNGSDTYADNDDGERSINASLNDNQSIDMNGKNTEGITGKNKTRNNNSKTLRNSVIRRATRTRIIMLIMT